MILYYRSVKGINTHTIIQKVNFISATSLKHVVIRKGSKEAIDDTVHALKVLQTDYGLVMFVISSFNRNNYLTIAGFKSFKESGLIEYYADFVAALQLLALSLMRNNTVIIPINIFTLLILFTVIIPLSILTVIILCCIIIHKLTP